MFKLSENVMDALHKYLDNFDASLHVSVLSPVGSVHYKCDSCDGGCRGDCSGGCMTACTTAG